jgi:hypothetical protein
MSIYQKMIKEIAPEYDPRHIEAYMRLQYSTLNGLSYEIFRHEINVGVECIKMAGVESAEQCAQSFGL